MGMAFKDRERLLIFLRQMWDNCVLSWRLASDSPEDLRDIKYYSYGANVNSCHLVRIRCEGVKIVGQSEADIVTVLTNQRPVKCTL